MGQDIDAAVFFAYVIECAPAGEVGLVGGGGIRVFDVARILVPSEFHTFFSTLDDPLFVEQVDLRAEGRFGDLSHQFAECEMPDA